MNLFENILNDLYDEKTPQECELKSSLYLQYSIVKLLEDNLVLQCSQV